MALVHGIYLSLKLYILFYTKYPVSEGEYCYTVDIALKSFFFHLTYPQEGKSEATRSDRRYTTSASTLHCASPLHLWQITKGAPIFRQTGRHI